MLESGTLRLTEQTRPVHLAITDGYAPVVGCVAGQVAFHVRNPCDYDITRSNLLRIGNRSVEIVAQGFVIDKAADRLQSVRFEHFAETRGAVAVVAPALDFDEAQVPHVVQREGNVFLE